MLRSVSTGLTDCVPPPSTTLSCPHLATAVSVSVLSLHTHTQPFNSLWSGTTQVGRYQKKHSPTHTHPDHRTSFINFSIYYDPQHPLCSVYVLDSPLWQPLCRSSLVFFLVLEPKLHTPYISSPNHHLLFAAHAVIPMLCHLYLVSLSAPYLEICLLA